MAAKKGRPKPPNRRVKRRERRYAAAIALDKFFSRRLRAAATPPAPASTEPNRSNAPGRGTGLGGVPVSKIAKWETPGVPPGLVMGETDQEPNNAPTTDV